MYKISMPRKIIDALADCLASKSIKPIIQDDPPKNKTLEVKTLEDLKELGLCLQSFNQETWGDIDDN